MIPRFPIFKRLELGDQAAIEHFVRSFAPYSDFNFVSLMTYDVRGLTEFAFFNGNLVVAMNDYLRGDWFLTFLGTNRVADTAVSLLEFSNSIRATSVLRLVPAVAVEALNGAQPSFEVVPDAAGFDYIYAVTDLVGLHGSALATKRQTIAAFKRSYPKCTARVMDLHSQEVVASVLSVLQSWRDWKARSDEDVEVEFSAIVRCLALAANLPLVAVGTWLGDDLLAFTINEVLSDGFYMGHFGKSVPSYRGLADFMEHETAKVMKSLGCDRLNNQQDLGLKGLRRSKQGWKPSSYLEKFTVRFRDQ